MYVENKMVTDIVSVFPEASISLAFQLMHEKNVSQLPVVKDGKLVGLITETLLSEFTPSKATSLSMYELNYILSKTKVESIMTKNIATCSRDMLIENVAIIMLEEDVNMVPVVNENNTLIGLISRNDILESYVEIIGARDIGTRITINAKDEAGTLAEISHIIKDFGVNITHVTNFNNVLPKTSEIIIRMNTNDVDAIVEALKSKGYEIVRIDQNNE
jgi:acetoin utilization protein AcuB